MENAKLIFSTNLKQLMQENDMRQQDLINVLQHNFGIKASPGSVSSWANANKLPHTETIEAICDYFGITISQIFGKIPTTAKKSLNDIFSQNLRDELDSMQYTSEEFCQQMNAKYEPKITKSSVTCWITGKQIPELETIRNISHFFGHSIDFMLSYHAPSGEESVPVPIVSEEKLKIVFADNLRVLLKRYAFNQEEFIEEFNGKYGTKFTQQSVSEWVNAKKMPRPIVICQIEALFGVNQGYLLTEH